ncbi:hypothetical protein HQ520_16315 [bacterium]|nr:hypothetical protein [bacterium]
MRRKIQTLTVIYADTQDRITTLLMSGVPQTAAQQARMNDILKQVNREIVVLNQQARAWAGGAAKEAYQKGMDITSQTLSQLGYTGSGVNFGARMHVQAVNVIADQMTADLLTANGSILRNATRFVRSTQQALITEGEINRQIIGGLIEGKTRRDVSKLIERRLMDQIEGGRLLTINGRNYQPRSYAELVARTRTREATSRGTVNATTQAGVDLVQISDHGTDTPICQVYEGKTFSISGGHSDFPQLDRMPPFHPGCWHAILPVIENVLIRRDEYDQAVEASNQDLTEAQKKAKQKAA